MDENYFTIRQNFSAQIYKVKKQLQEKLQDMLPLPEILKMTQAKLNEARIIHQLVDRNNKEIAKELSMYKGKIAAMDNYTMETTTEESRSSLILKVQALEEQLTDLRELNDSLKSDLKTFETNCDKYEKLADKRLSEITQLETQLEYLIQKTQQIQP